MTAFDDAARNDGVNHVRQYIDEDGRCRRLDDINVKKEVRQRREQKDDARQSVQEVNHRVEKTSPAILKS